MLQASFFARASSSETNFVTFRRSSHRVNPQLARSGPRLGELAAPQPLQAGALIPQLAQFTDLRPPEHVVLRRRFPDPDFQAEIG